MPSRLLDGELKEELTIGYVLTLGITNGVTMVSSRLNKEIAESTTEWLLVSQNETYKKV